MPREQIGMTPAEVDAFLASKRRLFLGTLDAGGAPLGDQADYVYEDGKLIFTLPRDGISYQNIVRDRRICTIVEQVPAYYEIKAVVFRGAVEEVTDPAERARLLARLGQNPATADALAVLRLGGEHQFSFDFSKIQRRY